MSSISDLLGQMTPQERNLYLHHIRNYQGLGAGGGVYNPNGSYSTVLQTPYPVNGQWYNIPTVWNGQILNEDQAAAMAAQQGWGYWPSYPTQEAADRRYRWMHQLMDIPPPSRGRR